ATFTISQVSSTTFCNDPSNPILAFTITLSKAHATSPLRICKQNVCTTTIPVAGGTTQDYRVSLEILNS
ncbi:8236_t:CDS:2, partial [Dentiscutata erythropus]